MLSGFMYDLRNAFERGVSRHFPQLFYLSYYMDQKNRHWETPHRDSYGNNVAVILYQITRRSIEVLLNGTAEGQHTDPIHRSIWLGDKC